MTTDQTIKLIALDMDGTLLTSTDRVSEANKEAIQQARQQGVQVMLSTGRWLGSCYPFVELLELDAPIITVNGGEIWTASKELLERHTHDAETMEMLFNLGLDVGVKMWVVSTEKVYNEGDYPTEFATIEWLKIGYSTTDLTKLEQIKQKLATHDNLELTNSLPTNIEVNPRGVNKANALVRVCKELGITLDEVMAVGDSLNDIKMIQQAGLGIAMGNAQDEVKAAADYMTTTNNDDGVANAIKRHILST